MKKETVIRNILSNKSRIFPNILEQVKAYKCGNDRKCLGIAIQVAFRRANQGSLEYAIVPDEWYGEYRNVWLNVDLDKNQLDKIRATTIEANLALYDSIKESYK